MCLQDIVKLLFDKNFTKARLAPQQFIYAALGRGAFKVKSHMASVERFKLLDGIPTE